MAGVVTRDRILEEGRKRFFKHGFERVTVDEIASGLGISKKTFYKHFPSKEQLLWEVVGSALNEANSRIEALLGDRDLDFPEKMKGIMVQMGESLSRVGKPLMEDVRTRYPDVWDEFQGFRRARIRLELARLLEEGVRKGYFRKDVDLRVFVLVYANAVTGIVNPDTLSDLPLSASEVFGSIVLILFEGIMTDRARASLSGKAAPKSGSRASGVERK